MRGGSTRWAHPLVRCTKSAPTTWALLYYIATEEAILFYALLMFPPEGTTGSTPRRGSGREKTLLKNSGSPNGCTAETGMGTQEAKTTSKQTALETQSKCVAVIHALHVKANATNDHIRLQTNADILHPLLQLENMNSYRKPRSQQVLSNP